MNDLNRCEFIGRLGNNPEIRYSPEGKAVARISLACNEKWKGNEKTTWVNIVAFNKLAEIIGEHLKKGSQVYVSGRLSVNKWQAKDGTDRYTTEILANDLQMLGGRSENSGFGGQSKSNAGQSSPPAPDFDDFSDSIPF